MWQQFRQKSNHLHPHRVISLDNGSGSGGGGGGGESGGGGSVGGDERTGSVASAVRRKTKLDVF